MGTHVVVEKLPVCDTAIIAGHEIGRLAKYDAATRFGAWAYMCEDCFQAFGLGALGTGVGQVLVLRSEVEKAP
jgi:hypothetical protein